MFPSNLHKVLPHVNAYHATMTTESSIVDNRSCIHISPDKYLKSCKNIVSLPQEMNHTGL